MVPWALNLRSRLNYVITNDIEDFVQDSFFKQTLSEVSDSFIFWINKLAISSIFGARDIAFDNSDDSTKYDDLGAREEINCSSWHDSAIIGEVATQISNKSDWFKNSCAFLCFEYEIDLGVINFILFEHCFKNPPVNNLE